MSNGIEGSVAGAAPPVSVRFLRPAPALTAFVDAYYFVETTQAMTDLVLASPGNIRFAPRGTWVQTVGGTVVPTPERAALFGPTSKTAVFGPTGPGLMIGAGLTPLGWAQLFDVPASELSDRIGDLAAFVGQAETEELAAAVESADSDAAVGQVLDDWLTARVAARPAADPRIAMIHTALLAVPRDVAALASASGVSERTLQRLCARAFGFSPKALLSQKRFQRTLEKVRDQLDQPLSSLLDDEYYDQPHFNRDFRYYMGMSPTEYFNSPREIMRRAAEVRRKLNGQGIQGLHPVGQP